MNKLFLTIFTFATASFAPMQAMMLSAVRQAARPALPQAQRPVLSVPQRPAMAPAVPTRPLLQPRSLQRPYALQAHAFSSHSHNTNKNNQNSQYFKPEQPTQKSSSWFGYLLGAAAAVGIGYDLFGSDEIDKLRRSLRFSSLDKYELDEISQTQALITHTNLEDPVFISKLKTEFLEKLMVQDTKIAAIIINTLTQNANALVSRATNRDGLKFLNKLVMTNPQVAEIITNTLTQTPNALITIVNNSFGNNFLEFLMERHPKAITTVTAIITTNENILFFIAQNNVGRGFLEFLVTRHCQNKIETAITMITKDPELVAIIADTLLEAELENFINTRPLILRTIANAVLQNPDTIPFLAARWQGRYILQTIMGQNPQVVATLTASIIQYPELLTCIARDIDGILLLKILMSQNPQTAIAIVNAVLENSDTIYALTMGQSHQTAFLENLFNQNPQATTTLIATIIQNPNSLTKIAEYPGSIQLFEIWMSQNPKIGTAIGNALLQNPETIFYLTTDFGQRKAFLKKLMNQNPKFVQQFIDMMFQNLDKFLDIASFLLQSNPELKKTILQRIKEKACKTRDYENFPKMFKLFQLCMEKPTQTSQHLQSNLERTLSSVIVEHYVNREHLNKLYHKVVEKEEQLQHEGYFTFVHGQQRAYYLPEMLYTHLWQIFNNRQLSDFMFAHVKEPATDMQHEERKLQKLRQNGRKTINDRQRLLFLNYAFFGNDTNLGSSSALYLAENNNVGDIAISPQDACAHFNCLEVYEQHKQELDTLDQEYRNLSSEGTLLLIGVPQDKVNEMVYSARSGGYKQSITIKSFGFFPYSTDNTRWILETLREHPEKIKNTDEIEFCLIMTQKGGGLDPETGIKVIPFIPGDEQKLQELEQRRINLFARIKKSIEEKTQQA